MEMANNARVGLAGEWAAALAACWLPITARMKPVNRVQSSAFIIYRSSILV